MKKMIIVLLSVFIFLTGCETLFEKQSDTKIEYNQNTGLIKYHSNKTQSWKYTKDAKGAVVLRIESDAAAGIRERKQIDEGRSDLVNKLIDTVIEKGSAE